MINVEHKQTHVIVTFTGNVTESSIIDLVGAIDRLRSDYFYRRIELRIASPGGDVVALDYFIDALSNWKRQALTVITRALTTCSSAAAIMLSLGDRREASPSSILLYHYSRISVEHRGPMTSDSAEEVSRRLKNVDDRMRTRLVDRVVARGAPGDPGGADELKDIDKAALREIRIAWSARPGERMSDEDDEAWLETWLEKTRWALDEKELRGRWSWLYDVLLDEDKPVSAALAVRLGLVDRLVEPATQEWNAPIMDSVSRWFEIPEWEAAYPGGKVDERYLKRHTLVLGETGSGKTRSAILPILAAAYRSPRVGVGLVIDPKHELDEVLQRWSSGKGEGRSKRLVRMAASEFAIDLMSSSKWSIKKMLASEEYWSAAQHILRRIATITDSNPARILLGQSPTSPDSYWPQEGTAFASTVVAVAIDLLMHPEIYARNGDSLEERDRIYAEAAGRMYTIGFRIGLYGHGRKARFDEAAAQAMEEANLPDLLYVPTVEEMEQFSLSEGEKERRKQHRRGRAIMGLMEHVKNGELLPQERKILSSIEAVWIEGEETESEFDTTIRHIGRMLSDPTEVDVPNVFAVASMICEDLFPMMEANEYSEEIGISGDGGRRTPLHALASMIQERAGGEFAHIGKQIKKYADMRESADKQYAGVYGAGVTIWQEAASKEIRNTLYFGCEPVNRNKAAGEELQFLEFTRDVDRQMKDLEQEPGVFYVYQPDLYGLDNLIAKAYKVLFFESVLGSGERARNGGEMPLAAYIADEFQRFITADRVHGEQSFLDVCRSFGAFTVIACQSIASLHYALSSLESDTDKRKSAIDIICNNTATKIFFRTTDQDTSHRLGTICPQTVRGVLVTNVRPLSTLGVGECYASFPDGRFERIQLEEFSGGG